MSSLRGLVVPSLQPGKDGSWRRRGPCLTRQQRLQGVTEGHGHQQPQRQGNGLAFTPEVGRHPPPAHGTIGIATPLLFREGGHGYG